MLLLIPCDPLNPRKPDEHFAPEAAAARQLGFDVALVDHDALGDAAQPADALRRVPMGASAAVYRGWMLRSEQYTAFAEGLAERGVTLRTSPSDYRRAHELPGWAAALAAVTPETAWTAGFDLEKLDECCARLGGGPAVLRDYVKSMKHYWHEAVYLPDVADRGRTHEIATRFLELRDDDFTGGLVLRRFEHFLAGEVRTWWLAGRCVLISAHPDSPDHVAEPDLRRVAPLVAALDLPFVTVDLALRQDGEWRVIELGDRQVSDRPTSADPHSFIAAMLAG
ncbi:MAG: hypothetical protein DLM58_10820 [Pseudonocardiales bacterium]|nr:MAG: hypothetical protein DLM58_10820 [Pseudonocardiales bacterium]